MTDFRALGKRAMAAGFRMEPGCAVEWSHPRGAAGQQVFPTFARVAEMPMGPLSIMYCLMAPSDVPNSAWPILTDPATVGILLAQVREAWSAPFAQVSPALFASDGGAVTLSRWVVYLNRTPDGDLIASGATEAEALVAALEAAKGHECAG